MAPLDTASPVLLERERETAALIAALDGVPRGGRAIVIEGEPGTGKTSLLAMAADEARRRRHTVLSARAGELDVRLGYGVARQLFEPVVAGEVTVDNLWTGPAALASSALGLGDRPVNAAATEHGMYWLARTLAAHRPLVVLVDDGQWTDDPSMRVIAHLARSCTELATVVIVTWRTDGGGGDRLRATLLADPAVSVVTLGPLTAQSSARLVRAALGASSTLAFQDACHQASGGNPFLLDELLRTLIGEAPPSWDDAAAERVRSLSPPTVTRSVLARLARLPETARHLASILAVLDSDATHSRAAKLAGFDGATTAHAIASLTGACILDRSATPPRFRHPLLRTVVYEQLAAPVRAALHSEAAALLDRDGLAERAVPHLLRGAPLGSRWAVERLVAAAATRPPDGALLLLRRALEEPPAPQLRPAVLAAVGEATIRSGQAGAIEPLRDAYALAADPATRERAVHALALAFILVARLDEAASLVTAEIEATEPGDAQRRLRLEADLAQIALVSSPHAAELASRLDRSAEGLDGRTSAERALLSAFAVRSYERLSIPTKTLLERCEHALHGEDQLEDRRADSLWPSLVVNVLCRLDRPARAGELAAAALEDVGVRRSAVATLLALGDRGQALLSTGALVAARIDLEEALALAELTDRGLVSQWLLGHLVHTLTLTGDYRRAEQHLDRNGLASPRASPVGDLLYGRAILRAAEGRFADARSDLDALRRGTEERGVPLPAIGVRPLVARCLVATGGDRAMALALAEEELATAIAFGVPSEIGVARRERALLRGGPAATAELARAVEDLAASPRHLQRAITLLELGASLRRGNERSKAREPLRGALAIADRCGAAPVTHRAAQELRALGDRPRRSQLTGPYALTPAEDRVVRLAAQGLTTAQIAQVLVVSRKTVESQLTGAYRKLGVHRRQDLPAALATPGRTAP